VTIQLKYLTLNMEKEEIGFFEKIQLKIFNNLFKIEISVLLILSLCFLLDVFYKTHIIKVLTVSFLANCYLFTAKFDNDTSVTTAWEIFISKLSKMSMAIVLIGFLFYIMNWPNPPVMFNNVGGINLILCFIAFVFFKQKNPKSTIITNEMFLRIFVYASISVFLFFA
jgi:hypothetical protein